MSFDAAVNQIPSLKGGLRRGLQAMGANSTLVHTEDTRKCDGSVDIDTCLENVMPQDSR